MKKISALTLSLLSISSFALSTHPFKDNTDIPIHLSDTNYNRLVVRGDKIKAVHFPEGAMLVRNDDEGSLYAIVSQHEPFTLFLSTELGHHFSATVHAESDLGKTLEFVSATPTQSFLQKNEAGSVQNPAISNLMTHMISREKASGFEMKRHFNQVIRLQNGIVLMPKLSYIGTQLSGEVTEIYNRGSEPLHLNESLFQSQGLKVISFTKKILNPKEKGLIYRVEEATHG